MPALTSTERRAMRAKAQHLDPVVMIGQHGLTAAVQHEIDIALTAHELIKLRVQNDSRVERQAMLAAICTALDCAPVQHLGKLLIVWRANPDKPKETRKRPSDRKSPSSRHGATGNAKSLAGASTGDAAADRRRRRNAQGGKAGDAKLPYFSRRGAGRFIAGTADSPPSRTSTAPASRRRGRG